MIIASGQRKHVFVPCKITSYGKRITNLSAISTRVKACRKYEYVSNVPLQISAFSTGARSGYEYTSPGYCAHQRALEVGYFTQQPAAACEQMWWFMSCTCVASRRSQGARFFLPAVKPKMVRITMGSMILRLLRGGWCDGVSVDM